MDTVTVNGVALAVEQAGEGPPVVFVHGSWSDHHAWDLVVPGLADQYRVVTYDRRGHSASDRPDSPHGPDVHADDLAALIDQLDLAPAHVVTNSYGGVVALGTAVRHPGRIADLCVHEPPLFGLLDRSRYADAFEALEPREQQIVDLIEAGDHEAAARQFIEELALGPGGWQVMPTAVQKSMAANAPTFPADARGAYEPPVTLDDLEGLEIPVLLTDGGASPRGTPFGPVVELLVATLPNATRHTFERAGHAPHRTHPAELARLIDGFIGGGGSG